MFLPRGWHEQTTSQKSHKISKNMNILEFGDDSLNHHEKYIQISTNMSSIGIEICEILRIWAKNNNNFTPINSLGARGNTMKRDPVLCVVLWFFAWTSANFFLIFLLYKRKCYKVAIGHWSFFLCVYAVVQSNETWFK